MFVLCDSIVIQAPIERCFQLSTSLEIVALELRMTPIAGRMTGLVTANDTVHWRGRKFGLPQFHVSLIDGFDPPHFFRDRMIDGRFRTFEHEHWFEATPDGVLLKDELRFTMPFGPLGWLVGRALMVPHIRGLMQRRFQLLKRIAETDEWRRYLPT